MICPSTMTLAAALIPGVNAAEVRTGQSVTLIVALSFAILGRFVFVMI